MKDKKVIAWAIVACIVTAAVCLIWGYKGAHFVYWLHEDNFKEAFEISDAGSWGESFAGLNTLFSGLAFIAVSVTILLQYYSNKERLIDKKTEEEKYKKDQFDKNFYQILNMIEKSRDNLYYNSTINNSGILGVKNKNKGYLAFDDAYKALSNFIEKTYSETDVMTKLQINQLATKEFYNNNDSLFGIYFRILYTLLKKIDETDFLTLSEKYEYGNLLRSQLSSKEVIIIAINGLNRKSKDLNKYIIEFRLLRYSENGKLRRVLKKHYPAETFEARND